MSITNKVPSDFDIECQMSLQAFQDIVSSGGIIEDDGTGYFGTDCIVSDVDCFREPPTWATHVYWYNK